MKRLSRDEAMAGGAPGDRDHFTGPVRTNGVHTAPDPYAVRALVVTFEDGARTFWHRHTGGQVLHVIEGSGRAGSREGGEITLEPGDVVVAAPDEEHWHGAAEGGRMTHLAISIGETWWAGPPD